jgi:hypothetical protein
MLTRRLGGHIVCDMKRRWKWLRLRLLKGLRSHYMLAATAAVVAVAAAAGLGAFDPDGSSPRPREAQAPRPLPMPVSTTDGPQDASVFTVTYVLVGSEEERDVWHNVEETINQRELLSRMALEVLVITNDDEEAAAFELIDAVKERYPWNEYVIQDLRVE